MTNVGNKAPIKTPKNTNTPTTPTLRDSLMNSASPTTILTASPQLRLTPDQKKLAEQLLKDFKKLPADKAARLDKLMKAEAPEMWTRIQDAKTSIELKKVSKAERKGQAVGIDELPAKLGWDANGWQMNLIRSLDEPSQGKSIFKNPGKVTVAELLTALRNPDNPSELSTASYERLKRVLTTLGGDTKTETTITTLDATWERDIAKLADEMGDKDGNISADELQIYVDNNPTAKNRLTLQNLGVMLHQVAGVTGEPDPFHMGQLGAGQLGFVRTAYAGAYDAQKNVSTVIAQVITANDIKQRKAFDRDDAFRADDKMGNSQRVTPEDYTNTGFDRGHLASNADAADANNAFESFLMSNMAPQYPRLNRGAWRFLEDKVRDVVEATGAHAMVYTGTLFLKPDGTPMSDAELQRIGKNKVAVPSHSFKSVLLRYPDGTYGTMSFMVKNQANLPTKEKECAKLLQESRVSIGQLEKLCGVNNFFSGFLPSEIESAVKADNNASLAVPANANKEQQEAVQFLFGDKPQPKKFVPAMSSYEVDMYLGRLQEVMGNVKSQS